MSTEVKSEDVRVGTLRVHVARPATDTTLGILLYPTVMGLDDPTREYAAEFARGGLNVVVWDPYNGEEGSSDMREMVLRSKECEDRAVLRDLSAIVDHMESDLGMTAIAGLGWCFGGRIALLHGGSDDRIRAVSTHNPTITTDVPTYSPTTDRWVTRADSPGQTLDVFEFAAKINGPVQLCHPALDFTPTHIYQELFDVLKNRTEPTFYELYPEATHGFNFAPGDANARARRIATATTLALLTQVLKEA